MTNKHKKYDLSSDMNLTARIAISVLLIGFGLLCVTINAYVGTISVLIGVGVACWKNFRLFK